MLTVMSAVMSSLLMIPSTVYASTYQSLREAILKARPGEEVSIERSRMIPSMDLPTVIGQSDLVVEGIITNATSAVTEDYSFVTTTYAIKVSRVLSAKPVVGGVPSPGVSTVFVTVLGGDANLDGRLVHAVDSSLPLFSVGAHLVICLQRHQGKREMSIMYGPFGAFRIDGEQVRSLVKNDETIRDTYDGMGVDAFRSFIQAVAR